MFSLEQIRQAHAKVKKGSDFPSYVSEIKSLGVLFFETYTYIRQTRYFGTDGHNVSSPPEQEFLSVCYITNPEQFKERLLAHQQGKTDYVTFCKDCAQTGIEKWLVSLVKMTCTYFDKAGNIVLVEKIP